MNKKTDFRLSFFENLAENKNYFLVPFGTKTCVLFNLKVCFLTNYQKLSPINFPLYGIHCLAICINFSRIFVRKVEEI